MFDVRRSSALRRRRRPVRDRDQVYGLKLGLAAAGHAVVPVAASWCRGVVVDSGHWSPSL